MTIEIVEFELAEQHYAMDIQNAREIVEMLPITPIPLTLKVNSLSVRPHRSW